MIKKIYVSKGISEELKEVIVKELRSYTINEICRRHDILYTFGGNDILFRTYAEAGLPDGEWEAIAQWNGEQWIKEGEESWD